MKSIRSFFYVTALFGCFCQTALSAVTFTVSPAAVSNTYSGFITLQVTNIPTGDTVVVQKFLDIDTNAVINGRDLLVQQFNLTDGQAGMVIGNVTNYNVPGDLNSATGAITATLNFQNGDFMQNLIGKYFYKLSSPVGHFTPLTNTFTITNFPFAQKFTGNVVSNKAATTLSNAVVVLFPPPRQGHDGPGQPLGGTVANIAGAYTIMAPAGTYTLLAFRSNYVGNIQNAPVVTLGSGLTVNTNLTLTNATGNITGKVVDAGNNTIGLPGVFMPLSSTNGFLVGAFTDSNGNFNAQVTASQWNLGSYDGGLIVHGYVGFNNSSSTNVNSGANVTVAFPKATAMFYGNVTDGSGNPLVGIDINDNDNSNLYSMDGYTDTNGNYFVGVLGGLGSNDPWQAGISGESTSGFTNYIFSQPLMNQNGGTNLVAGQAVLVNFTALLATNTISGTLKDNSNNAISNVQVYANATINGASYMPEVNTDVNGNYTLFVPNGDWSVSVFCGGDQNGNNQNSLSNIYMCPNPIAVTINNNNVVTNFVVQQCNGISITPLSPLPIGEVNLYYNQSIQALDCNSVYNWSQTGGSLPGGTSLNSSGSSDILFGFPASGGTFTFTVQVTDGNGDMTNRQYSVVISNAVQIITTLLPNGTNGLNYSQQLQATAGVPFGGASPYSWSLSSGSLPSGLNLSTNGLLSGSLTTSGTFNFTVQAVDTLGGTTNQPLVLNIVNTNTPTPPPVNIAPSSSGGQMVVYYPMSGSNYVLQTATNVAGPWAPATNGMPAISFVFSNTSPVQFFRLQ